MTRTGWLLISIFAATIAWCYYEANTIMDTSGCMAGFHPLVLFAVPVGSVLSTMVLIVAVKRRSFFLGMLSVIPVVALGLPILFAYDLSIAGWSREIGRQAIQNEAAIKIVDLSTARFDAVPYKDDERMVEIPGFRWTNADTMNAAKNGVFSGFMVNGVPHVYICPMMSGARGVAWVTDTAKINKDPDVRYVYSGVDDWYIWTL